MNYFKSNKILMWVLIVLLIINASAVGTLLFSRVNERPQVSPGFVPEGPPGFIKEKLRLSKEQMQRFHNLHMDFREAMNDIRYDMNENRIEILEEVSSENPDSDKLDKLAREYGDLHQEMKSQTIKHFLKMKESINPDQEVYFREFIKGMREFQDLPPHSKMRRHDSGHRHRWGKRSDKNINNR